MPQRIQLSRKKGWRMPDNTVKVDRTTKHGNPFKVGECKMFCDPSSPNMVVMVQPKDVQEAVDAYRWYCQHGDRMERIKRDLAGKDLAFWCRIGEPCHADVLLELANQ